MTAVCHAPAGSALAHFLEARARGASRADLLRLKILAQAESDDRRERLDEQRHRDDLQVSKDSSIVDLSAVRSSRDDESGVS